MKITYSELRPEYLNSLVKIHRESFKDHFNSRLGNFYTKKYLKWLSKKNEFDSFIICAYDEDSNRLIGYICGARNGYQNKINRDLIFPILVSFILKPWLIFDKRFMNLFLPKIRTLLGKVEYSELKEYENSLKQPIYNVLNFGIDEFYKSEMNLGFLILEKLFGKFFEEIKKRNVGTLRATVRKTNDRVVQYYKLKKWTAFPYEVDSQTIFFYKELS
jgi:hypothetical protein